MARYSPPTSRLAELLGAQPVTVQAAQLTQDGHRHCRLVMSSGSRLRKPDLEHLKYFYDAQAWLPKNAVLANKAALEALDAPTQAALLKAAASAEDARCSCHAPRTPQHLDLLRRTADGADALTAAESRPEAHRRHSYAGCDAQRSVKR